MAHQYNDPAGGSPSTVGNQIRTDFFHKQALKEARKEQYFSQLANTKNMPKNMGKKIKAYHYLPLLDDANINDQGLDAAGATIADGNLYGSSKDIGAIPGKMPTLTENGGKVNRVGFKRKEIEGTLEKYGFYSDYTQESLDFDSDSELMMHVNREMINGAVEITEDLLQIDLLTSAGVVKYAGSATADVEMTDADMVTYGDLLRLAIDLDNNRTPKQTKVVTGTRMIDTKTIAAARVLYVGSELIPLLEGLTDSHGNPAFIPVAKYAAGGAVMESSQSTVLTGEVGAIGHFRIVVVPEMMKWAGAGGDASVTATHHETANAYDVFPMLCVGDGSFSTIGFQTDGKTVKFKIKHSKPGSPESYANDPYGETGFMSIKWYYGFLLERPERIAVLKTTAIL